MKYIFKKARDFFSLFFSLRVLGFFFIYFNIQKLINLDYINNIKTILKIKKNQRKLLIFKSKNLCYRVYFHVFDLLIKFSKI